MSAEHDYVMLAADLDFGSILAVTGRQKPSVIQIRDDLLTPSAIESTLLACIRSTQEELAAGALVSLDGGVRGWGSRLFRIRTARSHSYAICALRMLAS